MPIRYVGKPSPYKGKVLFHLLCNLPECGKGRVVIRSTYLRYPEPTYYRVVSAEPAMDPETENGTVWLDHVFRGVKCGVSAFTDTFVHDWQLLTPDEEKKYCKPAAEKPNLKILPSTAPFPPLLQELVIRDMKSRGLTIDEEPQLPMKYKEGPLSWNRVAKEGEKPTVEFSAHACPELYEETCDSIKQKDNV